MINLKQLVKEMTASLYLLEEVNQSKKSPRKNQRESCQTDQNPQRSRPPRIMQATRDELVLWRGKWQAGQRIEHLSLNS